MEQVYNTNNETPKHGKLCTLRANRSLRTAFLENQTFVTSIRERLHVLTDVVSAFHFGILYMYFNNALVLRGLTRLRDAL